MRICEFKECNIEFLPKNNTHRFCCQKHQVEHWRLNNRERYNAVRREYMKTKKYKKRQTEWKKRNWEKYMKLHLLHRRVRRKKPIQDYCTICNQPKKLELANIDGQYSEDVRDYMYLCFSCHKLFDRINKTHMEVVEN